MVTFGALKPPRVIALPWRAPVLAGSSIVAAALVVLAATLVIYPYIADAQLRRAIDLTYRSRPAEAQAAAELARSFAPQESVYAVEVGNIAVERHDLIAARDAYVEATRLGTYNAFVYMNLALVDLQLGRRDEALSAARKAVELNRFDPATQALVAQIEAASP
jgi:tetratricopeptide (TPR) repeat protein